MSKMLQNSECMSYGLDFEILFTSRDFKRKQLSEEIVFRNKHVVKIGHSHER